MIADRRNQDGRREFRNDEDDDDVESEAPTAEHYGKLWG